MISFQGLIFQLKSFWAQKGCAVLEPMDMPMGAGTFHWATIYGAVGPETWRVNFVQPCRRPTDGRYGENPNRLQHYYQFQVFIKPSPADIVDMYLESLEVLGIFRKDHDIRFVEDDWESPTLGAWGLGWEVWLDGMEITQFTYFQQVGGLATTPPAVEITYGLERLSLYLQNSPSIYDLLYHEDGLRYGDLFLNNEKEQSVYNFQRADVEWFRRQFDALEEQCADLLGFENTRFVQKKSAPPLVRPAYERAVEASHAFNMLEARGALSTQGRAQYIGRLRRMVRAAAQGWQAEVRGDRP